MPYVGRHVQYGFVIDHSRCIGCHACTVACKSENDVPLGSFRTWVKYTEEGEWPAVRRGFAVLRCNQCSSAPCVTICPVTAIAKRPDGIVDIDPAICIGCKSCMQACPYDAIYIHPTAGTAQKCHFCAHRVERGLAPACAVVCPTEAIIPGDFHDPQSRVSRLRSEGDLLARRVEVGTGPNVLYRDVNARALDPSQATGAGGYLWAERKATPQAAAETFLARPGDARVTYDAQMPLHWGWKVGAYLFTKSLGAGALLAALLFAPPVSLGGGLASGAAAWMGALGLFFLAVTAVLLVWDLKRPERFFTILLRPNWDSWLARGAAILSAYGLVLAVWTGWALLDGPPEGAAGVALAGLGALLAVGTAIYTAWLFGQAKGRVLWLRRSLALELLVHALLGGLALLALLDLFLPLPEGTRVVLRAALLGYLLLHAFLMATEAQWAPARREQEYHRAHALLVRGPYARRHWVVSVALGVVAPLVLLAVGSAVLMAPAAALALLGVWNHEDLMVRAGQALPIH